MSFFNTFNSGVVEPAQVSYTSIALSANTTLNWPNVDATGNFTANIIEVTPSAGSLSLTMPIATARSVGQQVLFRNMTGTAFTVKDNGGGTISNVAANTAIFIYLIDNSTAAGSWSLVTFGTGTSSADSASLAGAGLKAIGITLNQKHDVLETTSAVTIDSTYRAKTVVWTTGTLACTLPAAASVGADFFFIMKNGGGGTITLTPSGGDTVDGSATVAFAPNDAAMVFSAGSANHWYTVGIGRVVNFAFTQLVKNVGGGVDVTLSSSECSNKIMTFTGVLTANINVIVTNTVSVYYIFNNTSGAFILTVKTAAGSGISVQQGTHDIAVCDASNVYRAVTNTAATTAFGAGSVSSPSITFIGDTNTGLYDAAVGTLGISTAGVNRVSISSASVAITPPLSITSLTTQLSVGNGGTGITSGTSGGVLGFTGASTIASSTALGANQLVIGGGAGATPTTPVSLGTTTTVLHGNAGGAPSFSAVSLTTDVSGILPIGNGGTGNGAGTATSAATVTNAAQSAITSVGASLVWGTGVANFGTIAKRKTADDTRTTSTLTNDTDLVFPIAANEEWIAAYDIDVNYAGGATSGGIQMAVTVPAGATVNTSASYVTIKAGGTTGTVNYNKSTTSGAFFDEVPNSGTGSILGVHIKVWVLNGGTAGNVQLQTAKSTVGGATNTLYFKGSILNAVRVA